MTILQNWFRLLIQILNAWNYIVFNIILTECLELVLGNIAIAYCGYAYKFICSIELCPEAKDWNAEHEIIWRAWII